MALSGSMDLGRRERQIMDVVFRLKRATAAEVLAELPDPPSYSAVRGMLRLLEDKGYLRREQHAPRSVSLPTPERDEASRSALAHLLNTFFDGSRESALAALLDDAPVDDAEYARLKALLEQARDPGDDE